MSTVLDRTGVVHKLEGLVRKLALRFARGSVGHYDDFLQEGMCGLLRALDRFDPEQGVKLITYAYPYIVSAMQAYAERFFSPVHIGHCAFVQLCGEARKPPAPGDVEPTTPSPPAWLSRFRAQQNDAAEIPDSQSRPVGEWLDEEKLHTALHKAILNLPPKQQRVILGVYFEEQTTSAIGQELNVTRERARQIREAALSRLRDLLSPILQHTN